MAPDYRSPTSGSAAAATTPARLAQEFECVFWRELPGGRLEVAVAKRRRGPWELLLVHDNGSTSPLGTVAVPSTRVGEAVGMAGMAIAGVAWVSLALQGHSSIAVELFVGGLAVFVLGWLGSLPGMVDPRRYLEDRDSWHQPTNLNGWEPRTLAQLAAVERVAEDHRGVALVRDVGAATVEVCGPRKRGLDRYAVDGDGTVELTEETPSLWRGSLPYLVFALILALWIGLGAVDRPGFGWVEVPVGFAVACAAATWLARQEPAERLERDGWIEIRTRSTNSD